MRDSAPRTATSCSHSPAPTQVRPLEELPVALGRRIKRRLTPVVFTPLAPAEGPRGTRDGELEAHSESMVDPFGAPTTPEAAFVEALRSPFPTLDMRDASPFLDELRSVKSEWEIGLMREAGRLTALAVLEAMRSTAPGVMEYELGALADFVFLRGGAFGAAYEPIVAAGPNIWHGHYGAKTAELQEGQLVLMDAAPDYRYYTSDIGRMWPVGGTWEPWQLELYTFIARYHVELLARIRPGATADEVLAGAADVMRGVLEETTFSKPAYEQAAREALDFPYHLSHPVGLSVHDVGEYRGRPFEPGHVFTVDPMLWVPDEQLYVRCEDTVVVTASGIENLTGSVPIDPARDRDRDARVGPPAIHSSMSATPALWFESPAPRWLAALPVGNGRARCHRASAASTRRRSSSTRRPSGRAGPTTATTRTRTRRFPRCGGS